MNSSENFLSSESTKSASETERAKYEKKNQSTHSSLTDLLKSNRNKLTAKWVIEDGRLVCRWIINDNSSKPDRN